MQMQWYMEEEQKNNRMVTFLQLCVFSHYFLSPTVHRDSTAYVKDRLFGEGKGKDSLT